MSQANVERLRAFWKPWGAGGWTVETWRRGEVDMSLFDPDVVYEDMNLPDHVGETYHGHDGVTRAAERWTEPFEWLVVELEDIIDAGDHLVSFHQWRAKARHTGIEIDAPLVYRWTFRGGKVRHFRSVSPEEAESLADLRDSPMSQQNLRPSGELAFGSEKADALAGVRDPTISQANVEIAKLGVDAFNRRDVEALAEVTTLDFEWFPALPGAVEGDGYQGLQGIETYLGEIRDTWDALQVVAGEYRELDDRVLVLGRTEGRGRGSGIQVDAPLAVLYDFRDGKISRSRAYLDHGEALRAAGLSE